MESRSWRDPGLSYSDLAAPPLQLHIGDGYQYALIPPPIHFAGGRFSGCTIRAELREIQRPQFGRRFGAVDRRVLDDPPVVLLRLFRVYDAGTDKEWSTELEDYDDIALSGLICMADLFEVPAAIFEPSDSQHGPAYTGSKFPSAGTSSSATIFRSLCSLEHKVPLDVLVFINGHAVTERSNRTTSLFGTKFVEPHKITLAGGDRKHILFTFSDLAVQREGCFILRYRFFDLFSSPIGSTSPRIQAECYGGSFRIYSTKEAPALKESTMLTKCLAKQGVRVNLRSKQRSPRKREFDTKQTPGGSSQPSHSNSER
ncbi:velvet factor-domain-containing protein [Mycena maculata]|uniref:Velvet factor-domain-containing protein n=1 Tax=Mycena maculata TaxID=230809 RepID=A0AAD7P2P0_9AGAR|nr:velvet factor-domain-containing protein [Mycena maculata]